jgi:hypothetical protein
VIALHQFAPADSEFEVRCLGITTDAAACQPGASAERRVFLIIDLVFNPSLLIDPILLMCLDLCF